MSESNESSPDVAAAPSPPPAPSPPADARDPAIELRRLVERLLRGPDRRTLLDYLRLRRTHRHTITLDTQP